MEYRSYDQAAYSGEIIQQRGLQFSTVFDAVFLPNSGGQDATSQYFAAADNTGVIRLYCVAQVVQDWLGAQAPGQERYAWQAHQGPVHCLACTTTADSCGLLLSGGDDSCVKAWRISDLLEACSGQPSKAAGSKTLECCFQVTLPWANQTWGGTARAPAVICLAVDPTAAAVYAGTSDGCTHKLDLGRCHQERQAGCSIACGGSSSTASQVVGSHAASVLSMDYSSSLSCLASGSEDGTVRLWDARTAQCSSVIDPGAGRQLSSSPADQLKAIKSPYVSAVKFESSGWLICGTGASQVTLWSMTLGTAAKQLSTLCVPQVLHVLPGEILVGGTDSHLYRYRFSGELSTKHQVSARSVFGLDVHPGNGLIAVAGTNGCIDLLSQYGSKVGSVFHASAEE